MREIRQSGSEGGEAELNRPSLPLSYYMRRTTAPRPESRYGSVIHACRPDNRLDTMTPLLIIS